eukprot:gene13847-19770_t
MGTGPRKLEWRAYYSASAQRVRVPGWGFGLRQVCQGASSASSVSRRNGPALDMASRIYCQDDDDCYLGTELARQLLVEGWSVRGSVRSESAPKTVELVAAIQKAIAGVAGKGTLQLFEADLLKEGSFDAACEGVDYVFHVASPFTIVVEDPQRDLVDVAVNGTLNVASAAAKAKVKRFIVTSSVAAVADWKRTQVPKAGAGALYTEADFNVTSTFEGTPPEGYFVSKVKAEEAAINFCKENNMEMVAINPDFIMGPPLVASACNSSVSLGFFKEVMEGKGSSPPGVFVICDVRDVAKAHILAATTPTANGRYIVSLSTSTNVQNLADWINKAIPGMNLPDGQTGEFPPAHDNSRVQKELGLVLTPVEDTIVDMAKAYIELGLFTPKAA